MPSVLSLQVGRIGPLGPSAVPSGFVKTDVRGPVRAGTLGLVGDEQADLTVHGGPDKAIYFYPSEHYPLWLHDVPRHRSLLVAGAFGENVTTEGFDETTIAIGDVLRIGSAEVQVTQPRQPCFKLGLRFADNTLGRIMMQSGRTGWYVRVLVEGTMQRDDRIEVAHRPSPTWTIARFNQFILHRAGTDDDLTELVALDGLADGWREAIAERLNAPPER